MSGNENRREPRDLVRTARNHADIRNGRIDWYRIDNARGAETHVYIYNEIGYWGITADDFAEALEEVTTGRITLHINSPGGSVFDGVTIYNALRDHPAAVHVMIDGVAASAASFIAMAGDTVTMNRGSEMMIHNAHGLVVGNSDDMREMANILDRQNKKIAAIYSDRTGGPAEHWLAAMAAETWYDPSEAVMAGLADRAVVDDDSKPDKKAKNGFDLSVFNYAGRGDAPDPVIWDGTPLEPVPDPEPEPEPTPEPEPDPTPEIAASESLARLRAAFNPLPKRATHV